MSDLTMGPHHYGLDSLRTSDSALVDKLAKLIGTPVAKRGEAVFEVLRAAECVRQVEDTMDAAVMREFSCKMEEVLNMRTPVRKGIIADFQESARFLSAARELNLYAQIISAKARVMLY